MTIVRNIGYVHIFVDLVLVNTYWSIELAGTPKETPFCNEDSIVVSNVVNFSTRSFAPCQYDTIYIIMLSIVAEIGMADNSRGGMSAKKVYPEKGNPKEKENIFILCDTCFWCAAYFGKFMLPVEDRCPICLTTELSSFPILSNESFTFDYDQKYGVELKFGVKNEY